MQYDNNDFNEIDNNNLKDHDLLLMSSDLSSGKKRILETQNKIKNSNKDNKINQIFKSNYSLSDKTLGNEYSKPHFDFLEEELLSFDKKSNNKIRKKEKPIFLSHSDYYYCLESKTEKNLNDQIMKYFNENNLNYKKKSLKPKKSSNILNLNNNNLEINGKTKENLKVSNSFQIILDNNSKENKILNNDNKSNNNEQILYTDILNYNIEKYLEQMKKCNNINAQINQINNIKIKNIFITNTENINKHDKIKPIKKTKETFNNLKTEKLINHKDKIYRNKIPFKENLFCIQTKKSSFSKNKLNKKISKNNNVVKMKQNKNNTKSKTNKKNQALDSNYKSKEKQNNIKKEMKQKFESNYNRIKEKRICEKKHDNKKTISKLSNISLQSMNDSKLMILADNIISKEEDCDKYDLNNNYYKNK